MNDVVILGGGMGGLFTAALLAKNGLRCTVLEKNHVAGGGLQMFKRYGTEWETGMHILGGFKENGSVARICRYLGILDKLDIRIDDISTANTIYCAQEGRTYYAGQGREEFVRSWAEQFPDEEEGLRAYVDKLYALTDEVGLFYLRASSSPLLNMHDDMFFKSAQELIATYIHDPRLRELLAFMAPMYGGVDGMTPAYVHAIINVLYIDWQGRFEGGSYQLAKALISVIEDAGGHVFTDKEVSRVHVEEKAVQWVETSDGTRYVGDKYVSAIHPCALIKLFDNKAFPAAFCHRMNDIPNTFSAFIVFLTFKPEVFEYINHPSYYMQDFGTLWHYNEIGERQWPQGMMCYTSALKGQGKWAHQMVVNCVMPFDCVRQWEDTRVGHRGNDYEVWKQQHIDMVMARLEEMYPGISDKIEHKFAASPLTIRDYYGTKEGSLYGFNPDCRNPMQSHMTVYTKVQNLLLTGQNINMHGICGVPLTAIQTAEAILGNNVILNAINKS